MIKIPISVVVSVKNEEINISECLGLLGQFSELIVVDSGSTDKTKKIAESFGATIVNFEWNGKFPKKRNWTLQNIPLKNEWVLFLDADEFVTQQFVNEVAGKINNSKFNGFTIDFENYFMGKKLRYGYPFKKNALFRKSKGAYEKIEEDLWSHLDMEVHEHPIIEGEIGIIKEKIIHRDFKSLEHYIDKHNAYSTWEAHRYLHFKNGERNQMCLNQKIKYGLLNSGLLPIFYFIGAYFIKLGFLDGKYGFYLALYKAHYFFQIKTKIELIKSEK